MKKSHSDQGVNSSYDLVFGSIRGLRCTWLVSHTRAFSYGVDDSDSGEWIHLKRGVDYGGCGPIGLHGHCIMLCGGVRTPSGEDPSEPTSDSEITPEPERVAPVAAGDMGTFVADSRWTADYGAERGDFSGRCPVLYSSPGTLTGNGEGRYARGRAKSVYVTLEVYNFWNFLIFRNMSGLQSPNHGDNAVSESSQNRQSKPMREATPRKLQRALAPLPPMGFTVVVEAATRTEMADQVVIQRKIAIGSDHGNLEISRDPVLSKGLEMKADQT
ncbi:hypothetical protein M9H77_00179 [Catharanthus roseus]|nr:hypothetical protein M9H77_00179 [Catharanthus roseus]